MSINLSEFIEYVKKIRSELVEKKYPKILITQTIQVATKNWVDTSNPSLSEKQVFKIMSITLAKTNLNLN
jgi:hypothetical protein